MALVSFGDERADQPTQFRPFCNQVEGEEAHSEQLEQNVHDRGPEAGQVVGYVTEPTRQGASVIVGSQVSRSVLDTKRVLQPLVYIGEVCRDVLAELGDLLGQQAAHLNAEPADRGHQSDHDERRTEASS